MSSHAPTTPGNADLTLDILREVKDYAIYLIDRDGRILTWNDGARRIKGYAAEEIIGQNFSRFFTAEDRQRGRPIQLLARARDEGRAQDEAWRLRKDGSTFWADVVITAIHEPDGSLRGYLKVTRDLTERRRNAELLRLSEERLRLLVENVKDYAIFMLDAQGKITTWGQGAERMLGFGASEVIGEHYSLFYPPELLLSQRPERELEIAASAGRYEEEGWRQRRDGERFKVNVVLTAIRDRDTGKLRGFAKVLRDLTEPLQMEEKARSAHAAIQARDEFISVAAHELRTPLSALMLKLQLAEKSLRELPAGPGVEKGQKLFERVSGGLRQAERLGELVERLLDVSRIVRGKLPLTLGPCNLTELTRRVVDELEETALAARSTVTVTARGDVVGQWDCTRLEEVVVNLLSNALKYGAGQPVELVVDEDASKVTLKVIDRGIGIRPDDVERIFSRFERTDAARHFGGLGLGLFISRNIVEAHGGTLRATSQPGRGSTFTAELPRR